MSLIVPSDAAPSPRLRFRVALLLVWTPAAAVAAVAHLQRVAGIAGEPWIVALLETLRVPLAWLAAWALLYAVLLRLLPRPLALALAPLLAIVAVVWTAAEYVLYRAVQVTGIGIDADLVRYAWARRYAMAPYVYREFGAGDVAALAVLAALCLAAVFAAACWARPRPAGWRAWPRLVAILVGWMLALAPSPFGLGPIHARPAPLALAFDALAGTAAPVDAGLDPRNWPTALLRRDDGPSQTFNLLVVLLESVRADAVGWANPQMNTTPRLDARVARGAWLAQRLYAVVPHTTKALTPIFCGYEPYLQVKAIEARLLAMPAPCLPHMLRAHGYRSVFFQSATEAFEQRRSLVANLGFDEFYALEHMDAVGLRRASEFSFADEVMLDPVKRWLDAIGERPFLAVILTGVTHSHYRKLDRFPEQVFHPEADVNRYLNNLYYTDWLVDAILQHLDDHGLAQRTVVVLMGDHGEAFREHGLWGHGYVGYDEALHVPIAILAPPGLELPTTPVTVPTTQLDLPPTLARLLGFTAASGSWRGRAWQDGVADDRDLFFHSLNQRHCGGVRRNGWKLLHKYEVDADELYHVARDPLERNDLARWRRDLASAMRRDMLLWKDSVNAMYEALPLAPLYGSVDSTPTGRYGLPATAAAKPLTTVAGCVDVLRAEPSKPRLTYDDYLTVDLVLRIRPPCRDVRDVDIALTNAAVRHRLDPQLWLGPQPPVTAWPGRAPVRMLPNFHMYNTWPTPTAELELKVVTDAGVPHWVRIGQIGVVPYP